MAMFHVTWVNFVAILSDFFAVIGELMRVYKSALPEAEV